MLPVTGCYRFTNGEWTHGWFFTVTCDGLVWKYTFTWPWRRRRFAAWRHLGEVLEHWSNIIVLPTSSRTGFLIAIVSHIKKWIHGTKLEYNVWCWRYRPMAAGKCTMHWKLHIVTAALRNYKFDENLWEIYESLLAVYVTLQQQGLMMSVALSERYTYTCDHDSLCIVLRTTT